MCTFDTPWVHHFFSDIVPLDLCICHNPQDATEGRVDSLGTVDSKEPSPTSFWYPMVASPNCFTSCVVEAQGADSTVVLFVVSLARDTGWKQSHTKLPCFCWESNSAN